MVWVCKVPCRVGKVQNVSNIHTCLLLDACGMDAMETVGQRSHLSPSIPQLNMMSENGPLPGVCPHTLG